jgi:hypothetical protein
VRDKHEEAWKPRSGHVSVSGPISEGAEIGRPRWTDSLRKYKAEDGDKKDGRRGRDVDAGVPRQGIIARALGDRQIGGGENVTDDKRKALLDEYTPDLQRLRSQVGEAFMDGASLAVGLTVGPMLSVLSPDAVDPFMERLVALGEAGGGSVTGDQVITIVEDVLRDASS